jgi:sulfonate transport system substrate-binding protein
MKAQAKMISILFIVSALVVGGVACRLANQRGERNSPSTVRMGSFSTAIDYAPYLVAKENGWFEEALKKHGAGVEYTVFQSLPPINEAIATDRIDVVFEAEVPAIIGRAAGIDLVIEGMSATLNADITIVPTSSEIKSIQDLKGKKIAVLAGTGFHYALLKGLERAGISRQDVTILDMTPPDAKAAFSSGSVDAWVIWSPWPEQEIVANKARPLPGLRGNAQIIMVARTKFTKDHPEMMATVQSVLTSARSWILEHPSEAQQLVSKSLDLPLEVVERAWRNNDWSAELTPDVIQDMQTKADFLKEEGFIKKAVDVEKQLIRQPVMEKNQSPAMEKVSENGARAPSPLALAGSGA